LRVSALAAASPMHDPQRVSNYVEEFKGFPSWCTVPRAGHGAYQGRC
jgi:hypothetical protein